MALSGSEKKSPAAGDGPEYSGRELVHRFAAILTTESGRYQGMATLLSSTRAVTPFHVLRKANMLGKDAYGILRSMQGATKRFTVGVTDKDADVAILEMSEGEPLQGLVGWALGLRSGLPESGARWITANGPELRNLDYLEGIFTGLASVGKGKYLRLHIEKPETYSLEGISGAPIIIDGKLAGLAALEDPSERSLYAIPISQILASKVGYALGALAAEPEETPPSSSSRPAVAQRALTGEEIGRLSDEVRRLFDRARQMSKGYGRRHVHTEHLLLAMQDLGGNQLYSLLAEAGADLYQLFEKDLVSPTNPRVAEDEESGEFHNFPPISGNVRKSILAAIDRATKDERATLEIPYILYGILTANKNSRVEQLKRLGMTADRVILSSQPTQSATSPQRIDSATSNTPPINSSTTPDDPKQGISGITSSEAASKSFVAGYNSDEAVGPDLLDVMDEVRTLASVLVAKKVEPPLSLGLFGEWGTGKSFFMKKLEERIDELSADAKEAEEKGPPSAYCSNVLQITFNAWNYIDSDLWASLAAEIFENLAAAIAEERKEEDSPETRALVLAAASSGQSTEEIAEQKKVDAEAELKRTEQWLADLKKRKGMFQVKLGRGQLFRQWLGVAAHNKAVQDSIGRLNESLGIDETSTEARKIESEILEIRGIWEKICFAAKNEKRLWVWLLAPPSALVMLWLARQLLGQFNVAGLKNDVLQVLAVASGLLAPVLAASRKVLEAVTAVQTQRDEMIEAEKGKQEKVLNDSIQIAQDNVVAAQRKVLEASRQLDLLRADRRMADYVLARHQSTDYTQKLGTISRVRNDLKRLSVLLRDVNAETLVESDRKMKERQSQKDAQRQKDGQARLFPRIDRIVLYIDDLDRCQEDVVKKVLDAVHLLLAFPLFVVVVGVDPRWLLYSLKQSSGAFRIQREDDGNASAPDGESHWHSTPMDYLEKIFQIPFTLRPIGKEGFYGLVNRYAGPSLGLQGVPGTNDQPDAKTTSDSNDGGKEGGQFQTATGADAALVSTARLQGEKSQQTPAPPSSSPETQAAPSGGNEVSASKVNGRGIEEGSGPVTGTHGTQLPDGNLRVSKPEVDRAPAYLNINNEECSFMKELHGFIPSPRAGKRFINIYRLLRASVKPEKLAEFEGNENGGPYQSAMVLLAILTTYPSQAAELFQKLMDDKHTPLMTWEAFWPSCSNQIYKELCKRDEDAKIRTHTDTGPPSGWSEWEKLISNMKKKDKDDHKSKSLDERIAERPIGEFVEWAPRVARYSFQSGRVLHYEHE